MVGNKGLVVMFLFSVEGPRQCIMLMSVLTKLEVCVCGCTRTHTPPLHYPKSKRACFTAACIIHVLKYDLFISDDLRYLGQQTWFITVAGV